MGFLSLLSADKFGKRHTGVVRANPKYLKANIFPYDERVTSKDVADFCSSLVFAGMVVLGEFHGESYYLIVNFHKHQVINRVSKFSYIKGADKHNIVESFNSVSGACVGIEYSGTKVKVKVKEKVKEKEKVKGPHNLSFVSGNTFHLNAIYDLFPKKTGKKKGLDLLAEKIGTQAQYDSVLNAVKKYKNLVIDKPLDMVTGFGNWVEGERWTDELNEPDSGLSQDSILGAINLDEAAKNSDTPANEVFAKMYDLQMTDADADLSYI